VKLVRSSRNAIPARREHPHESVCLGVQLPGHPADAKALELSDEALRLFVQLTQMCFPHGRHTIYLVNHDLRVM